MVLLLAGAARTAPAIAAAPFQVVAIDDELRVRRGDRDTALAIGRALPPDGGTITLPALRGETVAFQVIVFGDAPAPATLVVESFAGARVDIFREHFVTVRERSRNDRRPDESLGWLPAARPADGAMLGDVPDALIPVANDGPLRGSAAWHAFWLDLFVPEAAPAGATAAAATLTVGDRVAARFTITVDVQPALLPYRATSVFAFYEPERLQRRIGAGPSNDPAAVERQLWQLLHAHHVDALAPLTGAADVDRLADALTGALFSPARGYSGPGAGQPPAVLALGAYGQLGDPSPASLGAGRAMVDRLKTIAAAGTRPDVFLYAIDEDCGSPRAAAWKQALAAADPPLAWPVAVGQTCGQPPERQAADVALIPGNIFARAQAVAAHDNGRRAWIYNGALPSTGTLLLDAPPRGLLANGWIAALGGAARWFYWESTFWDDDNRGGRGAVDPFANPASFHNRDGDTALLDGVLVYPGRQTGPFAGAHSFGFAGVFPSLRLKMIRRGVQDAGYLALAAREHPEEAARIARQALPAILDEAPADQPASWERDVAAGAARFGGARAALRALITRADPPSDAERDQVLARLAAQRRDAVPPALSRRQRWLRTAAFAATVAGLLSLGGALSVRRARRRNRRG